MGSLEQTALNAFWTVRRHTERICADLTDEDQCIQSMPDASPAKWHRAHTTWFFEEFVLVPLVPEYRPFSGKFRYLFNSYYEAVGERHPRFARGMITRPGVSEVTAYRQHVDGAMAELLAAGKAPSDLLALGLQHEQQHQELLLTDMLHGFSQNPLAPAMMPGWAAPSGTPRSTRWVTVDGGVVKAGHAGKDFAFDNELPRHDTLLHPFQIADRLVRNSDWQDFIADGGYRTPTLWMSDGWAAVLEHGWSSPLYWRGQDGDRRQFTPAGEQGLNPDEPVRHVCWYEADAFARWAGARLPTEFELEAVAESDEIHEFDDHVWQWSNSAYLPYPGFTPPPGAIGEYNGKFMINQMVLRGGSMATPPGHTRPSYRNFFPPEKRWQFTGLRLAKSA